jgi:hypothetical protein
MRISCIPEIGDAEGGSHQGAWGSMNKVGFTK